MDSAKEETIEVKEEESNELEEAGIFGASDLKEKRKAVESDEPDLPSGVFFPDMSEEKEEEIPKPDEVPAEPLDSTSTPPELPLEESEPAESSQPKPLDPTNGRSQVLAQQMGRAPVMMQQQLPPLHSTYNIGVQITGYELEVIDIIGRYLFMEGFINNMEPENIVRYSFHHLYNHIRSLLAGSEQQQTQQG